MGSLGLLRLVFCSDIIALMLGCLQTALNSSLDIGSSEIEILSPHYATIIRSSFKVNNNNVYLSIVGTCLFDSANTWSIECFKLKKYVPDIAIAFGCRGYRIDGDGAQYVCGNMHDDGTIVLQTMINAQKDVYFGFCISYSL